MSEMDQILTVVSAEHVAKYLSHKRSIHGVELESVHGADLTSGLKSTRVRYLLCA